MRDRVARAVAAQAPYFPGDAEGTFDDAASEDAFCERFEEAPCPALDPLTGTCDLYDCPPDRLPHLGPPLRVGDEDVPPCALWFTSAAPAEVERARQALDIAHLEHPMTDEVEADTLRFGATTVAFALSVAATAASKR